LICPAKNRIASGGRFHEGLIVPRINFGLHVVTALACLGFLSPCVQGQNLAANPGFESGDTSGWFPFGSVTISAQTAQVHSGAYAAQVQNRTSTWNGIAQSLQGIMQPGETYFVSAWVKLVTGENQTVQLTIQKIDDSGTTYTAVASGSASIADWVQISGQFTFSVSGGLSGLTLYLEVPSSDSASFYFDDVSITAAGSTLAAVTVLWDDVHQVIDGFGAASAWRSTWNTTLANLFFSTNSGTGYGRNGASYQYSGAGLSLLRTRIAPGGTTVEQTIMQLAQSRGARVWSAPWSPAPAEQFKSNSNVNGGSFLGNAANYQAYASQLARYVVNLKNAYGVDLYALSIQNEPDANVTTYESCNWTAQQIHDFVPYLSAALVASNVSNTKIMLPESQNWTDPQGLRLTTMSDSTTAAMIGIIANHNYVANNAIGDQSAPAAISNYGKALWQTEVAKLSGDDSSISDGLYWARRVHQFLTIAQANAWHYWWLCAYGSSNGGLCDTNDVPAKRLYTLGNFSRFVRPGFHRIGISDSSGPLLVSAYRNLTNDEFAIVVVNETANSVEQSFTFSGFQVDSVTPWLTSASSSLTTQTPVVVNGSHFTNTIPPQSVVTLTGRALGSNSAPSLSPIADFAANAGVQLSITNLASDSDLPAQTLTFSLLNAPTNAVLEPATGVLEWRPLVSQGGTTNNFSVKVADDGVPVLSATNEFSVFILPVPPPDLQVDLQAVGTISFKINGIVGPDYSLLTTTNLSDWRLLLSTNPISLPLNFSLPITDPQRYYRLQLGP